MQRIMEELYMGNVGFDSGHYPPGSPFSKAARKKHDSLQRLMATLDDDEKELFDQYCESQGEIEGITRYDTFSKTLKFGILLMLELFSDKRE